MKPPKFLKAGDVVRLTMDGLGEQKQKIVKGALLIARDRRRMRKSKSPGPMARGFSFAPARSCAQ